VREVWQQQIRKLKQVSQACLRPPSPLPIQGSELLWSISTAPANQTCGNASKPISARRWINRSWITPAHTAIRRPRSEDSPAGF
jgi:hypothetical protein